MTSTASPRVLPRPVALCAVVVVCSLCCAQPDRSVHFPEGWAFETLVDSEFTAGWESALLPDEVTQGYSRFEVKHTREARARGAAACFVSLTPKPGVQPWAELRASVQPVDRCDAISLWVKNPEGLPAELGLKLKDVDGAEFTISPVQLGPERNWYELSFDLRSATSLGGTGQPTFPLKSISVLLGGLTPGKRHVFYLDELCSHRGPSAELGGKLDVIELVSPRKLSAGEACPVRVRLRAQSPLSGPLRVDIGLSLGGATACSERVEIVLPPEGVQPGELFPAMETSLSPPALLTPGTYTVTVTSPSAEVLVPSRDRLPTVEVQVSRDDGAGTSASVEGAPGPCRIVVRGKPVAAVVDVPAAGPQEQGPQAEAAALQRFRIGLGGGEGSRVTWSEGGRLDFSVLDRDLQQRAQAGSLALWLPDVRISCPQWWKLAHPTELMVVRSGSLRDEQPSFSSVPWRDDCMAAVGELVRHLENGPFADYIAGYQLSGGLDGRWLSWDVGSGGMGDYSEAQKTGFQQWLRLRYEDLRDLRASWGQPLDPSNEGSVSAYRNWGEVLLPTPALRQSARTWMLDPAGAVSVVDYRLFSSWAIIDHIAALVGAVRQQTDGRKVCGVPYGHLMELAARHEGLELGGHLALGQLLRVPELDFLVGPPAGDHVGATLMPIASLNAAGKALLPAPTVSGRDPWEDAATSLEQGYATATPSLRDAEALGAWAAQLSAPSCAEIAVIIDDVSCAYMSHGNPVKAALITGQMDELRRMGAPVDVWTLDDLLARRVPPARMYVFPNLLRAGSSVIGKVIEITQRAPALTLWLCAPGIIGDSFNARLIRDLTGIRCAISNAARPMKVQLRAPVDPFTAGVRCPSTYGLDNAVAPAVEIVDPSVVLLGADSAGRPALVARRADRSTTVLSLAPRVSASVLRSLAQAAGVHVYGETDDRFYANDAMVAISGDTPGRRSIRLPKPADVFAVPDGEAVATGATEFPAQLEAGRAQVFLVRPAGSAASALGGKAPTASPTAGPPPLQ